MNKAEWDLIVTDEAERDVHTLVQDKKTEEINTMAAEIIACTDEIKTRYQLIKGFVCDLMAKQVDFEKALKKIRKEAARYWDFEAVRWVARTVALPMRSFFQEKMRSNHLSKKRIDFVVFFTVGRNTARTWGSIATFI